MLSAVCGAKGSKTPFYGSEGDFVAHCNLRRRLSDDKWTPCSYIFTQVLTPMVSQGLLLVKKRKIQKSLDFSFGFFPPVISRGVDDFASKKLGFPIQFLCIPCRG